MFWNTVNNNARGGLFDNTNNSNNNVGGGLFGNSANNNGIATFGNNNVGGGIFWNNNGSSHLQLLHLALTAIIPLYFEIIWKIMILSLMILKLIMEFLFGNINSTVSLFGNSLNGLFGNTNSNNNNIQGNSLFSNNSNNNDSLFGNN